MSLGGKLRTYLSLGWRSLIRVGVYRLGLRSGLHPVQRLREPAPTVGPFFRAAALPGNWPEPDRRWLTHSVRFDWHVEPLPEGGVPDWFANPFGRHGGDAAGKPWWIIPDFAAGDIKGLWELSRFGWLLPLVGMAVRGEEGAAERLNSRIADWCRINPPYRGPNWKCGQEASIRVMHLAAAAIILDEIALPEPALAELVAQHCARISPTMSYAIGQDNNHGTSEAVALFIGGLWLEAAGDSRGRNWAAIGRRWLDDRARTLIFEDGSFSQYSVTYHRVMLDSFALAELWRRRLGAPELGATSYARLRAASRWLRAIVDPATGDAPNIGASDGARLLPLTPSGYRDFRPSVQLATILFEEARAYDAGSWDDALTWLGVALPGHHAETMESRSHDDGGWHVLHTPRARLVMRYPRFRFRPAQADALHVDLWVDGVNLLRDAGTYSYNDPAVPDGDFAGTAYHNSVIFDGRDQMPRLGRFLFGGWILAERVVPAAGGKAAAGYRDAHGNRHWRRVELRDDGFSCVDELAGAFAQATLRWRLPAGAWQLDRNRLHNGALSLDILIEGSEGSLALEAGREARDYHRIDPVNVLSVTVGGPCTISTTGSF
jgi:hypothetical protein